MVFLALRQRLSTIQVIIQVNPNTISKQMVKWAAGLDAESIVLIEGKAQKPQVPVESTTIHDCEVLVEKVRFCTSSNFPSSD
jgi:aspartyl/asparaginyl-tRNA synthetase